MERLNAYMTPCAGGGVQVDTGGMALDLITVLKANGITKEEFIQGISEMWDDIHVTISIPHERKN